MGIPRPVPLMRVDHLLVRCRLHGAEGLAAALRDWCADPGMPLQPLRAAWSAATSLAYAYAAVPGGAEVSRDRRGALVHAWRQACPGADGVDVSRLVTLQDRAGRSQGEAPRAHYVVEADFEAGWEDEVSRWYEQEHLPGLAAVPGCVRALRFRNLDTGPASLACYDLTSECVPDTQPWLAVRGTAWSDVARPHMVNLRRNVLQLVR
ncbi:MAG TPA: hypothetical protein VEA40_26255 [Ramlibacter sp.]|nr:hypothetical protein [Ramlibacter sp.]